MKKLILFTLLFMTTTSFGRVIVPTHSHHYNCCNNSPKIFLSAIIALNLVYICIYLFKTISWFLKGKKKSFYRKVIWSNSDNIYTDVNTIWFIITNSFVLLVKLTYLIYNLL